MIYTRVFDPFLIICAGYILIFLKFGAFPQDLKLLFFVSLINLVIPISYFIYLIKKRAVGNWDVTEKKQRRKIFGPLIIFIILSTIILFVFKSYIFEPPSGVLLFKYLLRIQLSGILLFSYLYMVSPFFKSSGHVGTLSVLYVFLLKIFGTTYLWVIILILVQGVARVVLKKHTSAEVIAGFISGTLIGLIAISI